MARKNLVQWMKKNDPEAYGYWKTNLAPYLGKSVHRTKEAIDLLKMYTSSPYNALYSKHPALRRVARRMEKYQNVLGASITFNYLWQLAKHHKRNLLRYRAGLSM